MKSEERISKIKKIRKKKKQVTERKQKGEEGKIQNAEGKQQKGEVKDGRKRNSFRLQNVRDKHRGIKRSD